MISPAAQSLSYAAFVDWVEVINIIIMLRTGDRKWLGQWPVAGQPRVAEETDHGSPVGEGSAASPSAGK